MLISARSRLRRAASVIAALFLFANAAGAAAEPLRFSIDDGNVRNAFFRDGASAAHVVATSGDAPRLIVAFPAGNSGAALFLDADGEAVWSGATNLRSAARETANGALNGVEFDISLSASARVRNFLIGDIRTIRLFIDADMAPPEETLPRLTVNDDGAVWSRRRVDGKPGYLVSVKAGNGDIVTNGDGVVFLETKGDEPLELHVVALTGDKPLTPIPTARLLDKAAGDISSLNTLAFLSYREKLLAGSWRFLTYFGRDTLLTLKLLSRAAGPELIEAGLSSVLERLNEDGEVAHEEAIGEFAVLSRAREGAGRSDEPIFDYKMIDDDFMLAPALAEYLVDDPAGRARAAAFLDRKSANGARYGSLAAKNLRFVLERASAFADNPVWRNLISLKPGEIAGDWRDSEEGLGGGRYPFSVNAALVPAALDAAARLAESGLLAPYLDGDENPFSKAGAMARIWRDFAPPLFLASFDRRKAESLVAHYAEEVGVAPEVIETPNGESPFEFYALALDADGRPIPVLHSDIAFSLAYGDPGAKTLARMIDSTHRAFPAGLFTGAGMLVSNPGFVRSEALRRSFDRTRYHGAVIWSWQQAMMAAGIERQLRRNDLDDAMRARLVRARNRIWSAICATKNTRLSELWSWSYADGEYKIEPFGRRGDATESNAAQLWSTVYLGVDGFAACR